MLTAVTLTPDPDPCTTDGPTKNGENGSITPSGAVIKSGDTDVMGNYDISYTNGKLEITPVRAKVTKLPTAGIDLKYAGRRNDQWLLVYPGEADTKMEYNVQLISRGNGELLKNADGVTYVRDNEAPTEGYGDDFSAWEAGTYHVWYRAASDNELIPGEPGCISVEIATVPLSVKPADTGITYGDGFPMLDSLTVTEQGFLDPQEKDHIGSAKLEYQINGEWKNAETLQGTCPDPGTYPARISYNYREESDVTYCYDITSVSGILTVEPKTVSLTWGNTSFTYNGDPHVPTATLSGLLNNEHSVTVVVLGEQVNAGQDYTAVATLSGDNANKYKLPSENTKTFSIAKKDAGDIPDVTLNVPVSANSLTASVAGKMPADAGTLSYSPGTITADGFTIEQDDFAAAVDENGLLTVTVNRSLSELAGKKLYVDVNVKSTNYNDKSIRVEATFVGKSDAGVRISQGNEYSVSYDEVLREITLSAVPTISNAGGQGTWTWVSSNPEVAKINNSNSNSSSDGNCTFNILSVGKSIISVKYDSDNATGYATLLLTVNPTFVTVPKVTEVNTYSGSHINVIGKYDDKIIRVTGTTEMKPGDYVATLTLIDTEKYRWKDGTRDTKYIPWRIEKQAGPAAPNGLQGHAPTTSANVDGMISGVSESMEYSAEVNFTKAISCTNAGIFGLIPGTYYVRIRETETTKAGAAAEVEVPECPAPAVRAKQGLVYNGSYQVLVESDAASNGNISYAVIKKGDPEPADGQYTISSPTAKGAGSYYVWYKASGNDKASYVEVTIRKKNATVMLSAEDKTYDGTTDATLTITVDGVCAGDRIVIAGVTGKFADKYVGGAKNVSVDSSGKIISGAENYVLSDIPGSTQAAILKRDLGDGTVVIQAIPDQYYTGSEIRPEPVVKCLGVMLEEGEYKDYTLSYGNNTKMGTASVTITGVNNCVGEITRTFKIGLPAFGTVTVAKPLADKEYGTALGAAPAVTAKDEGDQDIDLTGETVTVYYSSSSAGEGTEWNPEKTDLNAGTYYVWATVAEKTGEGGHAAARSELVSFKVIKNQYEKPDQSILPNQDAGYDVTVALPDGAKNTDYEYVITTYNTTSEPAVDSDLWSVLPVLSNGKFTASGISAGESYKIWLRRKADANHNASAAIYKLFSTPATVMLSYDLNGGSGTVPEAKSYASGTLVAIDNGAKVSRYGYSFAGWWDAKEGGTKIEGKLQITESRVLYAHWSADQYFVSFDANGGRGTMADQRFLYGTAQDLRRNAFSRDGYIFAGWATSPNGQVVYTDQQNVKNLVSKGTITLYAVWVDASWSVSGEIKEGENEENATPLRGITVTLMRGDTRFGSSQSTGADGRYSFSGVSAGLYNLVAERTLNGKLQKVTALVEVTSGSVDVSAIVMPDKNISSEIDVKDDTPAVMVGGLDIVAAENAEEGKEVTVTMTVETKSEKDAEGAEEIRQLAESNTPGNDELEVDYLDVSIMKKTEGISDEEAITETAKVIELIIPFSFAGKKNFQMLRFHEGEAMVFRKLGSRTLALGDREDGTWFEDFENSRIFVYSSLFSTLALSYESSSGYMITYRKNDGTGDQYIQEISADTAMPVALTSNTFSRSAYSFTGWNTEANGGGTNYTNGQNVTLNSDLVLYAQWKKNGGGGGGGGTPDKTRFTVSFELNGHGAAIDPQTVEKDKTATKPEDPQAEGFVFGGWFTSEECPESELFDFTTLITKDIILYAKWTEETVESVSVSFNMQDHGEQVPPQTIPVGTAAEKPSPDPVAENYTFGGWYTSPECRAEELYDFDTPVNADLILYAKWMEKVVPIIHSALDPVPEIEADTTELYLVKGQKFIIGKDWSVKKGDKESKALVSISKKGQLKAKKAGKATIWNGDRSLVLNISAPSVEKKFTLTIDKAEESVSKAVELKNPDGLPVYWYSASPDVAVVDQEGVVTAVSAGKAKVTAYINGMAYKCTVTVKESVPAKERTLHMLAGSKKKLSIKGLKKLTWSSADEETASFDKNKVTAKKAGETVLTATAADGTEYTVHLFAEDITMSGEGLSPAKGKNKYTLKLKAGESTELAFASVDQAVVFKSSKPDSAFIDENGKVSARAAGKSKFTAKINSKTITITVVVE
ncbi:MAG: InlB B-repeat-containing protein [Lachnospiraceae bacterium]|nr:InlB B-repeat-containing protein [Lachnospiraceae bacterium]